MVWSSHHMERLIDPHLRSVRKYKTIKINKLHGQTVIHPSRQCSLEMGNILKILSRDSLFTVSQQRKGKKRLPRNRPERLNICNAMKTGLARKLKKKKANKTQPLTIHVLCRVRFKSFLH